jgi:hypothetical protein
MEKMALCSTSETRTTVGEAAFGPGANAEKEENLLI